MKKVRPTEEINFSWGWRFLPLKNVCDSIYKWLHSKGIGVDTKATPLLSPTKEAVLWEEGVLSLGNPTGLLNAVFFYNGKNFCLRGGVEHRSLKLSQFVRETTTIDGKQISCYIYTEFGSKNNQGGLTSLNQKNKTVKHYETNSEHCHVKILDKYLEAVPVMQFNKIKHFICNQIVSLIETHLCHGSKVLLLEKTLATMIHKWLRPRSDCQLFGIIWRG